MKTNRITLNNIRPLCSTPSDNLLEGVRRSRNRFQAWLCINGVQRYLGSFGSNMEAGIVALETRIKRDSDYLIQFEENLKSDKEKLLKLKASLSRESLGEVA